MVTRRVLAGFVIVMAASTTSGCLVAAGMGPAALPLAMIAASPSAVGVSGTAGEPQLHPATLEAPVFDDAGKARDHAALVASVDRLAADADARLSASSARVVCTLSEDMAWTLIGPGRSRAEYERAMASLPPSSMISVSGISVDVIEGDCADGRPSGRFVAIGHYETRRGSESSAPHEVRRSRIEAEADRSGVMRGRFYKEEESILVGVPGTFGRSLTALSDVRDGDRVVERMSLIRNLDATTGERGIMTTMLIEPLSGNVQRTTSWVGSNLSGRTVADWDAGIVWTTTYPFAMFTNFPVPRGVSRSCISEGGREVAQSECAALAAL